MYLLWSSWNCFLSLHLFSLLFYLGRRDPWAQDLLGLGQVCSWDGPGGSHSSVSELCLWGDSCYSCWEQELVVVEIANLQWSEKRSQGGEEMRPQILPCPWGCLGRLVGARALVLWSRPEFRPRTDCSGPRGQQRLAAWSQCVNWSTRPVTSILGETFLPSLSWAEAVPGKGRGFIPVRKCTSEKRKDLLLWR